MWSKIDFGSKRTYTDFKEYKIYKLLKQEFKLKIMQITRKWKSNLLYRVKQLKRTKRRVLIWVEMRVELLLRPKH
jgi:hypothetical protein